MKESHGSVPPSSAPTAIHHLNEGHAAILLALSPSYYVANLFWRIKHAPLEFRSQVDVVGKFARLILVQYVSLKTQLLAST